jgi:alginate O-acetyltransferase complex protein AlgJ
MRASINRALAIIFLTTIVIPVAANLAGDDGADREAENREMADFPVIDGSLRSVRRFPAGLDAWFADHFGFRSTLVRWSSRMSVDLLGASPSKSVVLGRDGWLFYADDGADEDIASNRLLPESEVANWQTSILRARDWLHSRGIAYVFTIPPDKHVIYPEQLPSTVRRTGTMLRADQVFASLKGNDFVVNPRPALEDAARRERIFDVTDSHWNERGAFVAYQAIIEAVRRQVPTVPPAHARSEFKETVEIADAGDLAGMIGLKRSLREERLLLKPLVPRQARVIEPAGAEPNAEVGRLVTEIPGSTLPRAVVFRDSFTSALATFLSEHFSRVVYLWQDDFDANEVLAEHPDVVIQEIVGRHLYTFIPSPELVPEK